MRKLWFHLLILPALLLAACSQTTPAPAKPTAANTPEKAAGTAAPQANASTGTGMQCQIVSLSPTQGPTEASMFPPVNDKDWVEGNSKNPLMTITEYSDFQ